MNYVDGTVIAVPEANKQQYIAHARKAAALIRQFGAIKVVECWGDDVPEGKVTDFRGAVKAQPNEAVLFSWTEWPDKTTRDTGVKKMMDDPRMQKLMQAMPFDGERVIFGGFQQIVVE